MAESAHTTNLSRRSMVLGAGAVVASALAPAVGAIDFDATGYVRALRGAGHAVTLNGDTLSYSGCPGFGQAYVDVHRRFEASIKANPEWVEKVKAAVRAERNAEAA